MEVINVKRAPELRLTDAFTSSAFGAALLAQANTLRRGVFLFLFFFPFFPPTGNGQSSLGWRCLEIMRRSNVCRSQ